MKEWQGGRLRFRRWISLMMALCLLIQAVIVNVTLPVRAEEPESFRLTGVTVRDRDGNDISVSSPEGAPEVSLADPVYLRYQFVIENHGRPGDTLHFEIPEEIGVYNELSFALTDDDFRLKFARVVVRGDGHGYIQLLPASQYLADLSCWFEIETYWNTDKITGGDDPVELTIPISRTESRTFWLNVIRPEINADMKIEKSGSLADDNTITWKIAIEPETQPVKYPVHHVVLKDTVLKDQEYIRDSWTVAKVSGGNTAVRAAFGFLPSEEPEIPGDEMGTPSSADFYGWPDSVLSTGSEAARVKTAGAKTMGFAATGSDADRSEEMGEETEKEAGVRAFSLPELSEVRGTEEPDGKDVEFAKKANEDGSTELSWSFKFPVGGKYEITYQTRVLEGQLYDNRYEELTETGEPAGPAESYGRAYRVENTATVTFPKDAIASSSDAARNQSATADVKYPLVSIRKEGELYDSGSVIKWTVEARQGGHTGGYIKDVTSCTFLELDMERGVTFETGGENLKLEPCVNYDEDGKCRDNNRLHYVYGEITEENGEKRKRLRYDLGENQNPGRLTYYTTINGEAYREAGSPDITNSAGLGVGDIWYWWRADVLEPVKDVIRKEGIGYDAGSHQITWRVTVNPHQRALSNLVFRDELTLKEDDDNAQRYVPGTFLIDGTALGPGDPLRVTGPGDEGGKADTEILEYAFGDLSETRVIEFKTELLKKDHYQTNYYPAGGYRNTAWLTGSFQGFPLTQHNAAAVGTQELSSTVLRKTGTYNHVDNILDWEVSLNENRMTIGNAVLTDVIPEDQELLRKEDGSPDVSVESLTEDQYEVMYEEAGRKLTVRLKGDGNGQIHDRLALHIKTRLVEETLKKFGDSNTPMPVSNEAVFSGDGILETRAKGTVSVDNLLVEKTAEYENGDSAITWRIFLNQHRAKVKAATEAEGTVKELYLEDELQPGLSLDLDSVKLYENVKVAPDGGYELNEETGEVILDGDGRLFTTDGRQGILQLSYGGNGTGTDSPGNIRYENGQTKQDSSLFRFYFNPAPVGLISTADDVFAGKNYVLEFKTDISPDMADKRVEIKNTASLNGTVLTDGSSEGKTEIFFSKGRGGGSGVKGTVRVLKVDWFDPSVKLAGAEFSFEDVDERHENLDLKPVTAVTDEGGEVEFSGIYYNTEYKLKETKAPAGYKETDEASPETVVDVRLEKGKNEAGEPITETVKTITRKNKPKLGWIELTKESAQTREYKIRGAEIVVSRDKQGTDVVKRISDMGSVDGAPMPAKAVTGDDGKVRFEGLRCGKYWLVETKAPDGYAKADPIRFEIPETIDYLETYEQNGNKGVFLDENDRELADQAAAGIMKDEPIGDLKVRKADSRSREANDNPLIPVKGAKLALYNNEEQAKAGGTAGRLKTAVTGENGEVVFKNLKAGSYYVREIAAPAHYMMNKTPVQVELTVDVTTDKVVQSGDIAELLNEPVGSFKLTKKDLYRDRMPVSGAVITLECTDENSGFTERTGSTKQGVILFDQLPFGNYQWTETKLPAGYVNVDGYNPRADISADEKVSTGTFEINRDNFNDPVSREATIRNRPVLADYEFTKQNNDGEPLEGVRFQLYSGSSAKEENKTTNEDQSQPGPTGIFTSDADGKVRIKYLRPGTYTCKEITGVAGHEETAEFTFVIAPAEENGDTNDKKTLEKSGPVINWKTGEHRIEKRDAVTKERITSSETTIKVWAVEDQGRKRPESDPLFYEKTQETKNGRLDMSLRPGTYCYKEVTPPENYVKNPETHEFTVAHQDKISISEAAAGTPGNTVISILEDRPVPKYSYQIKKSGTKADGLHDRLLDGAEIGVFRSEDDQMVGTPQITKNGIVEFKDLLCGVSYYYKELKAPAGYAADGEKHTFKVEDNGSDAVRIIQEAAIENRLAKGSFRLEKTGSTKEAGPVKGAVFEVRWTGAGNVGAKDVEPETKVWQAETDETGAVVVEGLPAGEYECREVKAPKEYHVDADWRYRFTIQEDGEQAVYMDENGSRKLVNFGPWAGSFQLLKTDGDTQKPLAGAVIGVYAASNGKMAAQGVTGEDGLLVIDPLYEGDYYYKEVSAPYGYELDSMAYPFSVTPGQPKVERTLANRRLIRGTFELIKKGEDGSPLEGAEIGLYKRQGDELLYRAVTDKQGRAVFDGLQKDEQDQYYYKELRAPEGFRLDEEKHPFEFHISAEGEVVTAELTNYQKRGTVQIQKTDGGTGKPLKGAAIALYQSDGAMVAEVVTGEDGLAVFEEVTPGTYHYQETGAPPGYRLDQTRYGITVAGDHQTVKAALENQRQVSGGGGDPSGPDSPAKPSQTEAAAGSTADPSGSRTPESSLQPGTNPDGNQPVIVPEPDGSITITSPEIPPRTDVAINDSGEEEVYRGRSDDEGRVNVTLEPGAYTLIAIDDEGVPLAYVPITIEDNMVPLAAPDVGDHSLPAALLAVFMLGALVAAGVLIWKKEDFVSDKRDKIETKNEKHHL